MKGDTKQRRPSLIKSQEHPVSVRPVVLRLSAQTGETETSPRTQNMGLICHLLAASNSTHQVLNVPVVFLFQCRS